MRLFDVPQMIHQPSGEILQCFASGDEYFNWLHDSHGYMIIKDENSGNYTYAQYKNGSLEPSELIVTAEMMDDSALKYKYPFIVKVEDIRDYLMGKLSGYKVEA
ncbi:MAG: hypothetical protein ACRCW2_13955, partial [Cellulosilyticaceae bacterium]